MYMQCCTAWGARALTRTPAGDVVDLPAADLIPADGLLIMAAHASRARIFTEWLDPAVLDEDKPFVRDCDLDLFHPSNAKLERSLGEFEAHSRFRNCR